MLRSRVVLELVVTSDAQVLRTLQAPAFQRAGVAYSAAETCEEAERLVRDLRPQLALLAADLPGGDAYALCRRIKDDPELTGTSVVLLERRVLSEDALAAVADSGCDDVLALPLHPDDFYHHLAQLAGLPRRRHHRVPVAIEVELSPDRAAEPIAGKVVNLSPRGAGVEVPVLVGRALADLVVQFGGEKAALRCRIAWCHPNQRGSYFAGCDFIAVPRETRALLDQLALFEISRGDDYVTAALQGDFDEHTDFSALQKVLEAAPAIDFNMQAVGRMSPDGARTWCQLLAGLSGRYAFRHCSVDFVRLAASMPAALGAGEVVSAEAPYRCRRCERDELRLVEAALLSREGGRTAPLPLRCRACGELLDFADDPDRYFAFLEASRPTDAHTA